MGAAMGSSRIFEAVAGHPGAEKPHTHVVLWHVPAADEALVAK